MSDGDAVFDRSDLPTFRKMAEVYTRLAAEEGDAGAKMVHRIVAEVTTRLVAAMPVPPASPGKEPLVSAAEVLAQHRKRWTDSIATCSGCDWSRFGNITRTDAAHAAHQLDALKAAGYAVIEQVTTERRVMTPQGTSRPVGPEEQLGNRLRSLGWWIEERQFTEWRRVDGAEVDR